MAIGTSGIAQLKKIVQDENGKYEIAEDDDERVAVSEADVDNDDLGDFYALQSEIEEEQAEAEREAAEAEAAERLAAAKAEREKGVKEYPLKVSRKDRNFANKVNSKGQGKAHLLATGLAPAGNLSIRPVDQLNQGHADKGKSDLISFTGQEPIEGGQVYGGATAPQIDVKFRKIARAIARKKPDVAHLELHTGKELLAMKDTIPGFVIKDDEHQIRVKGGAIPKRMLVSSTPALNLPHEHDSDSDAD